MQTANIKIRINSETKQQAQQFAKNLGVSLNTIFNACLHRLVKTHNINMTDKDKRAILNEIKAVH